MSDDVRDFAYYAAKVEETLARDCPNWKPLLAKMPVSRWQTCTHVSRAEHPNRLRSEWRSIRPIAPVCRVNLHKHPI